MNVEMFFVQADSVPQVSDLVRQRLKSPSDVSGQQPDWGLPSSYDALLVEGQKRKVALSPSVGGWVAGVESKGVVDFALLQRLAETLNTKVIAVQLYEVSGCCGYAICNRGAVIAYHYSEDDEDPVETIADFLRCNGINQRLISFPKAIQMRNHGWEVL